MSRGCASQHILLPAGLALWSAPQWLTPRGGRYLTFIVEHYDCLPLVSDAPGHSLCPACWAGTCASLPGPC